MKAGERIVATALGGALLFAASGGLRAAENQSQATMKPLMAVSLDAGTKHVVGYFVSDDGVCKLTLMVAENADDGGEHVAPSRLQAAVAGGKSVRFDTIEGKSLHFACKPGARAMTVVALDRVATHRDAE